METEGTGAGDGGRQLASLSLGDTAKTVANYLGQAPGLQSQKGTHNLDEQAMYIGEGLPPVSPKLANRISKGEYIDMCDLLPEFLIIPHSKEEIALQRFARSRGWRRTQEIHVWLQCFVLYVAVVAVKCLRRVLEMMAYIIQIICASQEYEGLA